MRTDDALANGTTRATRHTRQQKSAQMPYGLKGPEPDPSPAKSFVRVGALSSPPDPGRPLPEYWTSSKSKRTAADLLAGGQAVTQDGTTAAEARHGGDKRFSGDQAKRPADIPGCYHRLLRSSAASQKHGRPASTPGGVAGLSAAKRLRTNTYSPLRNPPTSHSSPHPLNSALKRKLTVTSPPAPPLLPRGVSAPGCMTRATTRSSSRVMKALAEAGGCQMIEEDKKMEEITSSDDGDGDKDDDEDNDSRRRRPRTNMRQVQLMELFASVSVSVGTRARTVPPATPTTLSKSSPFPVCIDTDDPPSHDTGAPFTVDLTTPNDSPLNAYPDHHNYFDISPTVPSLGLFDDSPIPLMHSSAVLSPPDRPITRSIHRSLFNQPSNRSPHITIDASCPNSESGLWSESSPKCTHQHSVSATVLHERLDRVITSKTLSRRSLSYCSSGGGTPCGMAPGFRWSVDTPPTASRPPLSQRSSSGVPHPPRPQSAYFLRNSSTRVSSPGMGIRSGMCTPAGVDPERTGPARVPGAPVKAPRAQAQASGRLLERLNSWNMDACSVSETGGGSRSSLEFLPAGFAMSPAGGGAGGGRGVLPSHLLPRALSFRSMGSPTHSGMDEDRD